MKKIFKFILVVLISCISLLFITNAWCGFYRTVSKLSLRCLEPARSIAEAANDFSEATRIYRAAVRGGQEDAHVYTNYIEAARRANEFMEVREAFKLAVKREKTDANVYRNFIAVADAAAVADTAAVADAAAGEGIKVLWSQEAREAYLRAVKTRQTDADVHTNYMVLALHEKWYREVKRAYANAQRMVQVNDNAYVIYMIAVSLSSEGGFEEMDVAYLEAERTGKTNKYFDGIYILGVTKLGHFERAQEVYRRVARGERANAFLHEMHIVAASDAGDFQEAQHAFLRAIDSKQINATIHREFIRAALRAGNFPAAQSVYKDAIRRKFTDIDADRMSMASFVRRGCPVEEKDDRIDYYILMKGLGISLASFVSDAFEKMQSDHGGGAVAAGSSVEAGHGVGNAGDRPCEGVCRDFGSWQRSMERQQPDLTVRQPLLFGAANRPREGAVISGGSIFQPSAEQVRRFVANPDEALSWEQRMVRRPPQSSSATQRSIFAPEKLGMGGDAAVNEDLRWGGEAKSGATTAKSISNTRVNICPA